MKPERAILWKVERPVQQVRRWPIGYPPDLVTPIETLRDALAYQVAIAETLWAQYMLRRAA